MAEWLFIVVAIAAAPPPTIYRCPGDAGETLFSDRPCAGGRVQTTQPIVTVDMSHLSAGEKATLDSSSRTTSALARSPVQRTDAKTQDDRRCQAARDGLDRVRATKRHGYRASSAAKLDARERSYEAQRDRSCTQP